MQIGDLNIPAVVPGDPFTAIADFDYDPPSVPSISNPEPSELRRVQAQRKKTRQWSKWANDVIPSLIRPYLALLCATDSLRSPIRVVPSNSLCSCGMTVRQLSVACVSFQRKFFLVLSIENAYA